MSGFFGGVLAVGAVLSGLAAGDLLIGGAAGVIAVVPDVAVGQVLTSGGVGAAPAWSASPLFLAWQSSVADGASAVAHIIDGLAYSTTGSKLLSIRNNAVEKFSINKDGVIRGVGAPAGTGPAMWSNSNTGTNAGRIFVDDTTGAFMGYGATGITVSSSTISTSSTNLSINATGSITEAFATQRSSTRTAVASGSATAFLWSRGADTGLTASTEAIGFHYNGASARSHATGDYALQREVVFSPSSYAFVGASVVDETVNVWSGSPLASGGNATLTHRYSYFADGGALGFKVDNTTPSATKADRISIWARDIAATRCSLAVATEEAVAADVAVASTHSWQIQINGSTYKVPLVFVSTP